MKQPILIILAAGMGSRFGGLKQMTPVDDSGHAIIDYSLYDAYRAGFRRVCFVIKHGIEKDFKEFIGYRAEKYFDVSYVYQELDVLPEGLEIPEGRIKPWGTAHAVSCCAGVVDAPFVVINSDDYYGISSYKVIYDFLTSPENGEDNAIVAFELRNTVTEFGSVARGVCSAENGFLTGAEEYTKIFKDGNDAKYTLDGETFSPLSGDTLVSMNFWGFRESMMDEFVKLFPGWFAENVAENPLKCEYFLPLVVNTAINEGRAKFRLLSCSETWHGVTYREDLPGVKAAIQAMRDEGLYPEKMID